MGKNKKKKSNKKVLYVLIGLLVIGVIYVVYSYLGTTFKDVRISNNKSIEYSDKMLKSLYNEKENILYSDLTLNPTLTFYYEEGNDSVKNELKDYFNADSETLISNYDQIYQRYKNAYKRVNYAGSFWINSNSNSDISKSSKETADRLHFQLGYKDFTKSSDVNKINRWITKKSHNKVKGDLKTDELSGMHSVILGTLYFNEKWFVPYEPSEVSEGTFNGTKGNQQVTYLTSDENIYLESDTAKGFMKRYKDEGLYFVGIIPKDNHSLQDIDLNELMKSKSSQEVTAKIPEFEYKYEHELTDNLKDIGINSIFKNGNLDNVASNLYVEKILQKNYIRVDRKGTEAFSLNETLTKQWGSVSMPHQVYLDQPFIFMIYDDTIDQVLFVGQVNNVEEYHE